MNYELYIYFLITHQDILIYAYIKICHIKLYVDLCLEFCRKLKVKVINDCRHDIKYIRIYIIHCDIYFIKLLFLYYMSNINTYIHAYTQIQCEAKQFSQLRSSHHNKAARLTFCHNKNARISVLEQLMPSLLRFLHRLCWVLFSRSCSRHMTRVELPWGRKGIVSSSNVNP